MSATLSPLQAAAAPGRLGAKRSTTRPHRHRRAVVVARAAVEPVAAEAVAEDASQASQASTSSSDASATGATSSATRDVAGLKKRVVALAAASGRGQDATAAQKTAMETLVTTLAENNPTPEPTASALFSGDWELVYSDTHLFRSSPFFWALGRLLGPGNADFFYLAHSHQTGMFGGGVGRVVQSIDMAGGRLVSDCIVKASLGVPLVGFSPLFAGRGTVAQGCHSRVSVWLYVDHTYRLLLHQSV
jgi:hypothetical protein